MEKARDYSESFLDSTCRNRTERAWCSQVMETTLPPSVPHLLPLPLSQPLFFYLPSFLSGRTFLSEARNHPHTGLRGAAAPTTHIEKNLNKHGPLSLRPWHPKPGENRLLPPLHTFFMHQGSTQADVCLSSLLPASCIPSSVPRLVFTESVLSGWNQRAGEQSYPLLVLVSLTPGGNPKIT